MFDFKVPNFAELEESESPFMELVKVQMAKLAGPFHGNYPDLSSELDDNLHEEYAKRLADELRRWEEDNKDSNAFMKGLFFDIGRNWGSVLYHFTRWVLENAHFPQNINVLYRDGRWVEYVYQHKQDYFKQHLKNTTSLSGLYCNNPLLNFSVTENIDYCIDYCTKAGLATENTLVDSGIRGSIINRLHDIHAPFRSEMLMFFSINPYIKSFLTDYDWMWDFYKQKFGNKKESRKLRETLPMYCYPNFCKDLVQMFEVIPDLYKRSDRYERTEQGIVQPVLERVDGGTYSLYQQVCKGINASLKADPIPDLITSLTVFYDLWLANLQQPDDRKKHFLTIEHNLYKGNKHKYEDCDPGCLYYPQDPHVKTISCLRKYRSKTL